MRSFVIDTSVVVKWFSEYDEGDLEKAIAVRDRIAEGRWRGIVPDLLLYELANALRYNRSLDANDVKEAVDSIIALGVEVRGADQEVLRYSIEIACKYDITVYDAYFLALAVREKKKLITADYRFAERVKRLPSITRLSQV